MASMSHNGQKRLLNNIVSPYGLAIISYAFFLSACLIPPSTYSHYMGEPDLMFLDPATMLFYTLCVMAFFAGALLVDWLSSSAPLVERKFTTTISPTAFLLAPLLAGIALTAISAFKLIANNPNIILWLATQQGGNIKGAEGIEIDSTFTLAPLMLTASIWLVFWRSHDLDLRGWRRWTVNLALFFGVIFVTVAATLALSRNMVMLVVCGLAILYLLRKAKKKHLSLTFVLGVGTLIAACVALLFFAFAFLRGSESVDDQFSLLFGYTVASYNRLAAIVNGTLRYPYGGRGVYLSGFISFSHLFNQFVPVAKAMNWPEFLDVWGAEFGAIDRAGLAGGGIWSGAFGYIYSDLGWFSIPFVFGYGMLYGVVWNWMKRGRVFGVVLYPAIGFCALFWMGTNFLFDSWMVYLAVDALILALYEFVFVRYSQAHTLARSG